MGSVYLIYSAYYVSDDVNSMNFLLGLTLNMIYVYAGIVTLRGVLEIRV